MSEVAGPPVRPRRGRGYDLLAMLAIGLVIVAAGLLPAVTANSGGTVTVRGTVTLDGQPLPFFPVGFWTTADGPVSPTTTDANGGFTFDVSDTVDGYAYAGTVPDSTRAIMSIDGKQVVRGVMNTARTVSPIYQGRPTSTAKALFGGAKEVRFALQEAGRISGTSPIPASRVRAIQVRRADNSVIQTMRLDGRGRFQSMLLTPGQYGVVLVPKSPGLPVVGDAIVRSGATTTVALDEPVTGATVLGTVRAGGKAVGSGVPVLLEQDDAVLASTTTSSTGDWSFAGVAGGDYTVEVGRYDEPDAVSASASSVDVQIPGASPSPTVTAPTATPTDTPIATTPQAAAVESVQRTSDAVLPQQFTVNVPEVLGEVSVNTAVQAAGRLSGTVTVPAPPAGTAAATARVVVEEERTERVVRTASVGSDGRYSLGGLQPGTRYRVFAVTEPEDATLSEMGSTTATAGTSAGTADVVVDRPALSLSGTVANAASGRVTIGDASLLQRTATIDESGAYVLQGLVPGAFPVVITTAGRVPSRAIGVVVSGTQQVVDLQPGPQPATFKGWFINSGAGVPTITGTATDEYGDQVVFGPDTDGGHVTIGELTPGTYTYDPDSFRGSAPTVDGPWYYQPPTGTFSLSDNATTDVGPIVLHVKTH
ncbi:hypothetical protein [Amnibacterium kyonggiense]|uniref:Uncharacterized protein n=1 Tax=Amnibacterium kyonggiense TaxID=595671 RepID=A0A4V3EA62_9MICO|nr:hypothetical protein [Amnibacterium kyonggiense]TDS74864.1 hypothetical protein CLV52_3386 [Amnibacterium kyonggiense]